MPTLWTIGYERLMPEALAAELEAAGVELVLDVRIRPQSRRPGMSKTKLGALLGEHGIAYEHRRALGTPPDLKWLFKHDRIAEAREGFRRHLEEHRTEELDALVAELGRRGAPRTALLCLEADPAHCHRSVVAEALSRRLPALRVVDL